MANRKFNDLTFPQRILVIKLRHHGDMLLTTPVIQTLHENFPNAEIDVLLYKETESMLTHHPVINQCYHIDRQWKKLSKRQHIQHELALLTTLRQRHYHLVINLADQWRSAIITRMTAAPVRLGFAFNKRKHWFWQSSHTELVAVDQHETMHMVEQNLSILSPLQLSKTSTKATMSYLTSDKNKIDHLLVANNVGKNYIVIHPASRWFFKCWSEHKMAELINGLEHQQIILTASPDENELAMLNDILSRCNSHNIVNLAGQLTLPQLAALIDNARLFIGVDSVPMHMAAALRTPHVALFGPSKLALWHPWEAIGETIWAGDYGTLPDPDDIDTGTTIRYLDLIPVNRVLDSARRLLQ